MNEFLFQNIYLIIIFLFRAYKLFAAAADLNHTAAMEKVSYEYLVVCPIVLTFFAHD